MTVMPAPAALRRRALEILVRELDYAEAMRFVHLSELGHGDYTHARETMLPHWTPDGLLRQADALQSRRTA